MVFVIHVGSQDGRCSDARFVLYRLGVPHSAVGEPVVWTADDEHEQGTLSICLAGFDANYRSDWPRHHKLIGERLLRLCWAVNPFVEPLLRDSAEDPE